MWVCPCALHLHACAPMYVCMWEAEMEGIVVTELCEFSNERLGIYFTVIGCLLLSFK